MVLLNEVVVMSDVQSVCSVHALTTEVEEVMGLLIGHTDREHGKCTIYHTMQLERLDKRKDRVEISDEQLSSAFPLLDKLNGERKERSEQSVDLSVVGWYHSHPHITVYPSHVDVRTQRQWEVQDPLWVGLIFGVFSTNKGNNAHGSLIAFQSMHARASEQKSEPPKSVAPCSSNSSTNGDSTISYSKMAGKASEPQRKRVVANAPTSANGLASTSNYCKIPIRVQQQCAAAECSRLEGSLVETSCKHIPKIILKEMKTAYNAVQEKNRSQTVTFHNEMVTAQSRLKLVHKQIKPSLVSLQCRM